MKRQFLILISALVLISSCGSNRDVTGAFIRVPKYSMFGMRMAYMTIEEDGTFTYGISLPLSRGVCSGTWTKTEKRHVIAVKSYIQDMNKVPVIIAEDKNRDVSHVFFVLNNPLKKYGYDFALWTLNVDGKKYLFTGDTLMIERKSPMSNIGLSYSIADSLDFFHASVRHRSCKFPEYRVKDGGSNVFNIAFPDYVDENFLYYSITSDTLYVRHNYIRPIHSKLKMRRTKRYKIPPTDRI